MIKIKRTTSEDKDFQRLVGELDKELAVRDGDEHDFYAQYNKIDLIKHAVVAYEDDEAIGCGAIKRFSGDAIEIKRMFVPENRRGRGVASLVLKELENWAGELGFRKCVLETGLRQPEAIRLYEKNGYAKIPNYGQYEGMENSVCFEKPLGETSEKTSANKTETVKNISIRKAGETDAEVLAELGRETFHDAFAGNPQMSQQELKRYLDATFTVSQVRAELRDRHAIFLIAEIDGEPAAYAKLERGARTDGVTSENPVKLKRLYSQQKYIGRGLGKELMKRCLNEARRLGHDTIWLTVWEHNRGAQRFYRKWNFETCGKFEFQLGSTICLDKVMQLTNLNSPLS